MAQWVVDQYLVVQWGPWCWKDVSSVSIFRPCYPYHVTFSLWLVGWFLSCVLNTDESCQYTDIAQCDSSVVIDELFVAAKAATNDYVVSFFYFDYNKQVDQTPLRVLQTLLHQILSTHSRIPPVAEKMAEDLMVGKPLPSWKDIQELFINLCSDGRPVFIVLDALDECDAVANRKPILELIKAIKTSPARLLVTSRPYPPDVDEVLGDCPQVLVEASDKDIEKYVLEQIEENVEMRRMLDDGLKRVIVDSILDKSQGM